MLGAKIITSSDVSHVIPRRNWTTGTTYDMYEHNISSSNAANSVQQIYSIQHSL